MKLVLLCSPCFETLHDSEFSIFSTSVAVMSVIKLVIFCLYHFAVSLAFTVFRYPKLISVEFWISKYKEEVYTTDISWSGAE